jgi:YHS domain-containing protein
MCLLRAGPNGSALERWQGSSTFEKEHIMSVATAGIVGAALIAASVVSAPAHAELKANGAYNSLYAGLGAKGFDVVNYFTEGKPAQGKDTYTVEYAGVKWQFVSAEHRDRFKVEPQKYVPQYGGFCSWGVANGKLFDVDPVNGWRIVDGKLYMNFNADIQKVFDKDPGGFITRANGNWPKL